MFSRCVPALIAFGLAGLPAPAQALDLVPAKALAWKPSEAPKRFDTRTVYDYMDGGAELYLSYGMNGLAVQVYEQEGEPSITLNLFEMQSGPGAYGLFTYERLDADAGLGQGSEYASGMLRFWQGRYFVFMQAMQETPGVREAMFALGRTLAARLGPPLPLPRLPEALPPTGLRPLSVRYVLGRQLIEAMEPSAVDNALGLPVRCEAVLGRYGKPGKGERILLVKYPDSEAARKGMEAFHGRKAARLGEVFRGTEGWNLVSLAGEFALLVLDAADPNLARQQMKAATLRLKEALR